MPLILHFLKNYLKKIIFAYYLEAKFNLTFFVNKMLLASWPLALFGTGI